MIRELAASLVLCGLAAAAAAQESASVDCSNAATQAELNTCASNDYEAADQALNKAYQAAMQRMRQADEEAAATGPDSVGAVEALKKAQRGWIAYRDGHCEAEGFAMRGGSAEPMLVNGCKAELSRTRARELDALLSESN